MLQLSKRLWSRSSARICTLARAVLQIAASDNRKSLYDRSSTRSVHDWQQLTASLVLQKVLPSSSGSSAFVTTNTQP